MPGFQHLEEVEIRDTKIRILSAPYFLATKIEAFNGRGGDDPRQSHDFEDLIYIIDNRLDIVSEIAKSDYKVKDFLKTELTKIINDPYAEDNISAHLDYLNASERLEIVLQKINDIIG